MAPGDDRTSVAVEYAKCSADAAYFTDKYGVIDDSQGVGLAGGLMPFRLWPAQIRVMWTLMARRLIIILKARQLGISWLCCSYALWLCLFQPGKLVLLYSQGELEAGDLLRRIKALYDRLPDWLKAVLPTVDRDTSTEFGWSNGSMARSLPATQKAGRSFTASLVILDEAAYLMWASKLYRAMKPTIDGGGQLVVLSTADGEENLFHRIWTRAVEGLNGFTTIFLAWWERPGRDAAWYAAQVAEADDTTTVKQEYPSCLVGDTRVSAHGSVFVFGEYPEHYKGMAPTIRLTTSLGYQVIGTPNHEFRMPDGSWKSLEEIRIGEKVCLLPPRFGEAIQRMPVDPGLPILVKDIEITEELAEFLGFYMGDGSLHRDERGGTYTLSLVFDAKDHDCIARMKGLMERCFGRVQERYTGATDGCIELRTSSRMFGSLSKALGLTRRLENGGIRRHVHVPPYIFASPRSVVAAFLRGLFEADGFVGYQAPRVLFCSKWERFARDVQLLLLGFGITSKLTVASKINSNGRIYTSRTLALRKRESIEFMREIGFVGARKNERWRIPEPHFNEKPLMMEDSVAELSANGEAPVYDMEVIPEHYYSANGIWVHNSPIEAFQSSGNTRFDTTWIAAQLDNIEDPISARDLPATLASIPGLKVWRLPEPGHEYVLGGDVAEGLEHGDFDACPVLDAETWEQVAEIHGHYEPDEYARYLIAVADFYSFAWVWPERNNHGHAVLTAFALATDPETLLPMPFTRVGNGHDGRPGWLTNVQTKGPMIDLVAAALRDECVIVRSAGLLHELKVYRRLKGGKLGAPSGAYDDRVMGLAVALSGIQHRYLTPNQGAPSAAGTERRRTPGLIGGASR